MPVKDVPQCWLAAEQGNLNALHSDLDLPLFLGVDARFPNMNQTKHCWQNYVDYHKCILAKGEDFAPCRQFWLAYRSLCPSGWYQRWDEQRGTLLDGAFESHERAAD